MDTLLYLLGRETYIPSLQDRVSYLFWRCLLPQPERPPAKQSEAQEQQQQHFLDCGTKEGEEEKGSSTLKSSRYVFHIFRNTEVQHFKLHTASNSGHEILSATEMRTPALGKVLKYKANNVNTSVILRKKKIILSQKLNWCRCSFKIFYLIVTWISNVFINKFSFFKNGGMPLIYVKVFTWLIPTQTTNATVLTGSGLVYASFL